MLKKITAIAITAALSFSSMAQADTNDLSGIVGDYFVRTANGDTRIYFRLNGGITDGSAATCMGAAAGDIDWDIPVNAVTLDSTMALIRASREGMKPIRVIGQADVCASGGTPYGDTVFEISPNWQPGT